MDVLEGEAEEDDPPVALEDRDLFAGGEWDGGKGEGEGKGKGGEGEGREGGRG